MRRLASHLRLQGLRRQQLVTSDTQGLYAQFAFKPVADPALPMETRDSEVCRRHF